MCGGEWPKENCGHHNFSEGEQCLSNKTLGRGERERGREGEKEGRGSWYNREENVLSVELGVLTALY